MTTLPARRSASMTFARHAVTFAAWLVALSRAVGAQAAVLPFEVGERLEYQVSVGRMGNIGKGAMWVDGLADVRGCQTMVLRFELEAGKGPVRGSDKTRSWLDPQRMAALRFEKTERHPLSRHSESAELFPETRLWVEAGGAAGQSPSGAPLDELSFIYFLRTISLAGDSVWRFDRHFDAARNPTTIRVVGRRTLETAAGSFRTVQIEMRVHDPRRYKGEGIITIDLSDDRRRLPVRIESSMPVLGRTVLTLSAIRVTEAEASVVAQRRGAR